MGGGFLKCLVRFGTQMNKARHRIWMVWGWKPWKLARFTTFGPGWRSMSVATNGAVYWGMIARVWQVEEMCEFVAGETRIIAPDIAEANLIWMVCFVIKGVLPRGRHSDYILRVNRYSVHTLSITQLLFFVWAVMLACIHHCKFIIIHAFMIISSMFFYIYTLKLVVSKLKQTCKPPGFSP